MMKSHTHFTVVVRIENKVGEAHSNLKKIRRAESRASPDLGQKNRVIRGT